MTQVPYEKGALFLTELERAFGRERFDAFLLDYFDRHAFQIITTGDFLDDLKAQLFPLDPAAAAKIDLDAWVEAPGPEGPVRRADLGAARRGRPGRWPTGRREGPADDLPTQDWSTQEWLRFLRGLPEKLPPDRMAELDDAFGLTERGNAEIAAQWLLMAIRNGITRPTPGSNRS